jgi:hypothetical protein
LITISRSDDLLLQRSGDQREEDRGSENDEASASWIRHAMSLEGMTMQGGHDLQAWVPLAKLTVRWDACDFFHFPRLRFFW